MLLHYHQRHTCCSQNLTMWWTSSVSADCLVFCTMETQHKCTLVIVTANMCVLVDGILGAMDCTAHAVSVLQGRLVADRLKIVRHYATWRLWIDILTTVPW